MITNTKHTKSGRFTEKEVEFLKANHKHKTTVELGELMNRSAESIYYKLKGHGLKAEKHMRPLIYKKNDQWQRLLDFANTLKPESNFRTVTQAFNEFGMYNFLAAYKIQGKA